MENVKRSDRSFAFVAVALAAVFAAAALPAYRALSARADAQAVVTEKVHRWEQSYRALAKATASWDGTYVSESSVSDMLSLLSLVHVGTYGLTTEPDKLAITQVAPVEREKVALGLTRVCLASTTTGGKSLAVSAGRYRDLVQGVTALSERKDIEVGSITIEGDKPMPVAQLGGFCILLRGDVS